MPFYLFICIVCLTEKELPEMTEKRQLKLLRHSFRMTEEMKVKEVVEMKVEGRMRRKKIRD